MADESAELEVPEFDLSGTEKVSILLLSLGKETAEGILKHLNPREVQRLGNTMADLDKISHDKVQFVMKSFLDTLSMDALGVDPGEYAQSLMSDALSGGSGGYSMDASMLADQVRGLEALKWMHPSSIANMLKNEHPQVVAIILSYFDASTAAEVLKGIPERFQAEVIYRVANLSTIQPRALFDLNDVLESASRDGEGGKLATIGGVKRAAEMLNLVGGGLDKKILDKISEDSADLATSIEDKMFVFDDMVGIDDRGMQTFAAEIPPDVLVLALKGADNELKEKILNNMSKRQADILRDDLEAGGPVKLSEVEEAQRTAVQLVRRLADEGKLMMPGGGEEMI
ncbi:flagellar motor switch protein FliG [Thiomicrospira sp. ALE5]|uniref:flagellar motor switch protein FliG n=1 Tax=Thiomicrospira sp. ALE5 TaxID=748650 RepID=UPI0008E5EBBE|nr:flagellar motor switch protein FliG [Thiomicrospira sp. ALE5]SFR59272.1 flagellar motor switch protein FliG [Thiomicrospira sp. ALE5]